MVVNINGKRVPALKAKPNEPALQAGKAPVTGEAEASTPKAQSASERVEPSTPAPPSDASVAPKPASKRKKVKPAKPPKRAKRSTHKSKAPEASEEGLTARPVQAELEADELKQTLLPRLYEKMLEHLEPQVGESEQRIEQTWLHQILEEVWAETLRDCPLASQRTALLSRINLDAAGLDIGAEEIWGCVPDGRDEHTVRMFPTFTADLHALADWLERCQVKTVAMESTGVYWIPVYEILEARGFKVYLVNARHIKNVSGRKTDVLDCQWIQTLHTYGLLQASFRPSEEICTLRAYVRHRDNLISDRATHIQHMQKALVQMNVLLTNVISDITGQTGLLIIRAIVSGERDPHQLAQFRHPHCAKSQAEIAKALTGNYRPEHVFALKQSLELYDFYTGQLRACDAEIERWYTRHAPVVDVTAQPLGTSAKLNSKNAPDYDLRSYLYQVTGVDLTAVDGLNAVLVQEILSEIGADMSRWPTDKHFTSWLKIAPYNDISGGKVLRRKTGQSSNRAAKAFRLVRQANLVLLMGCKSPSGKD